MWAGAVCVGPNKNKPKDRCAFRWRKAAVYIWQIPRWTYIVPHVIVKLCIAAVCALALLACGIRGVAVKSLLQHPWQTPLGYMWHDLKGSRFIKKTNDGRFLILPLMFSPALWVAVALTVSGYLLISSGGDVRAITEDAGNFLGLFLFSMTLVILAIIALGLAIYWGKGLDWRSTIANLDTRLNAIFDRYDERRWKRRVAQATREREKEEERRQHRAERMERQVSELICATTGPRRIDVRRLPFTPKTFRLRFAVLKKDWGCRNYSAS